MHWVDADALESALPVGAAVDALGAALVAGLDPEHDGERTRLPAERGELLLMPSTTPTATGAKLVTVAPGNPAAGLPLVQGLYVLFDGATLAPTAVLDGAALTALRTPAVSALAVRHLAAPDARRAVVLGTGVQALGHARALAAVLPLTRLDVVGRRPGSADALARALRGHGVPAVAGGPGDVADVVGAADVVVCATTSPTPLFDGALLADHALVVAIGSHTPGTREVDTTTATRGSVVVESVASALREDGDVLLPVAEGALDPAGLLTLAAVVRGAATPAAGRPRLFTGTGMPWQDLVVATAVVAAVHSGA